MKNPRWLRLLPTLGYTPNTVVFFNYTTMQMTAKIVYYGPGLCGKTTNLQAIHQKTAPKSRGEMVSLETETDRTLFFDLLPLDVGVIGGMKVRLQLYTVPGQVFYNATRKLVLKGVDGVVFVVDSQVAMQDTNVESLANLKTNLAELGLTIDQIPVVFQYNKRDIRNIVPIEKLNESLNPSGLPYFEAAALHGIGVFETLKGISRLAIASVRKKVNIDAPPVKKSAKAAPEPAAAPKPVVAAPEPAVVEPAQAAVAKATPPAKAQVVAAPPAAAPAPAVPTAGPDSSNVLAGLVEEAPPVEFAEEDTDKKLRAVKTKAQVDIHRELEKIRVTANTKGSREPAAPAAAPGQSKQFERRLQDMLAPEQDPKVEVRKKAAVEVAGTLLKSATSVKVNLVFTTPGGEETLRDVVSVKLANKKLEKLLLHLDLDVKAKG